MLAREAVQRTGRPTRFKGLAVSELSYKTTSFECRHCANHCEIVQVTVRQHVVARWGGRCDRWEVMDGEAPRSASAPRQPALVEANCEACV
jgi:hypothetical protein